MCSGMFANFLEYMTYFSPEITPLHQEVPFGSTNRRIINIAKKNNFFKKNLKKNPVWKKLINPFSSHTSTLHIKILPITKHNLTLSLIYLYMDLIQLHLWFPSSLKIFPFDFFFSNTWFHPEHTPRNPWNVVNHLKRHIWNLSTRWFTQPPPEPYPNYQAGIPTMAIFSKWYPIIADIAHCFDPKYIVQVPTPVWFHHILSKYSSKLINKLSPISFSFFNPS